MIVSSQALPTSLINLQYNLLDKLVLSKLRAPLGGELTGSFIGGSALPVEVGDFFGKRTNF